MSIFQKIKSTFIKPEERSIEQVVHIYLDGVGLSPFIYMNYDLATLEDQLIQVLEMKEVGELDGDEIGEEETILFIYGPDAEKIFKEIEPVLRSNPLCQNARVVMRYGTSGASQREVRIP